LGLAIAGVAAVCLAATVYLAYFFLVLRSRGSILKFQNAILALQNSSSNLAPVSVIVSAFNESKVIGRKLANISRLNYPIDRLEVIVIDDGSSDGTADIAENTINELKLSGKVVRNPKRIGLNRSLNIAMAEAKNSYVCITDSDVMLEKDALRNSVSVLTGFTEAGGVTGKIQPVFEGKGMAQTNESVYRGFYHRSMLGESSLHSAFPGNGPLIVFNKSVVPYSIPVDYGSTDGNLAINVVKSGVRFIYVPNAVVLEPVPEDLGQQRLQKVRRAQRLIQVFLHNGDIFLNKRFGKFGRVIFPLKLLMVIVCPVLMFLGFALIALGVVLSDNLLLQAVSAGGLFLVVGVCVLWKSFGRMLSSFVFHQAYLLVGLFSSLRKSVFWKTIKRK
jgi:cellulose synthase/poly-beta-1,6-N-acetylglucosamine synthase-like glycosyltransferase